MRVSFRTICAVLYHRQLHACLCELQQSCSYPLSYATHLLPRVNAHTLAQACPPLWSAFFNLHTIIEISNDTQLHETIFNLPSVMEKETAVKHSTRSIFTSVSIACSSACLSTHSSVVTQQLLWCTAQYMYCIALL